ncbi:hypothetical protein B0813_001773 [Candidatus Fervidibacteria bacterium JGI MDM2 SSWTFF-3-K9]
MKRWLLGLSAIVVVVILALALWRSSSLIVERTVIAELPLGINRLVPTDLDGDSEPEILAVCSRWEEDILPIWRIPDYERISDPRIWFIRSPFGKPKATQLPYVCYFVYWWSWDLSSLLPLQRSVLVEEGELLSLSPTKEWRTQRLGWLKIVEGQLTFEPLLTVKGRVTLHLIAAEKLPTMLFINDGTRSFAFRLQPNGTWQPIDPKRVRPIHGQYFGDFDGDGLRDAIMTRELHWHNKVGVRLVEVYWGNGSPATVLFEERPPKLTLTRIWTADVENDGCWEIVTWDGKDLTVWKFRKHERRFAPTTQVALKPPRVAPKGGRFSLGMATVPPPPARFEPNFAAIDLNGDGRKEFLLFWEELLITPYSNFLPKEKVAVQVIWQQGGKIKVRQFDSKKIPLPSPLITTWTQNGHRFAFSSETYGRKRFRPRLISFRPLRLELWKMVLEYRSTLFQLPNGDEALDLRRWTKIAELPAYPMLTGDWDNDGRMELLLHRWFGTSSPHDILYFVRCDGKKVRWTKILPPSPAKVLHALPLKGRNGTAIFIVWELEDKAIIERLRWR